MAYTVPTAANLKARYPAFSSVDNTIVDYWIDDAKRYVDESWIEADYAPSIMAAAAHHMAREGLGAASGGGQIPAGVERFKSGAMDVSFNSDAVKAQIAGGWASTRYGLEYSEALARNKAGPRISGGAGGAPYCGAYNGFAGPLPPWSL
ncbi:DUF4054 domain-containing protein [Sphingomonas montanisoli]|uniref:DUF4054 domain-containing protein n=1 Tax=Sphingomonas montanisoli TaxID=2606412 RepID=A0A5D9C2D5_9SPHN|nr:DUF4054 domain-containing protein [Sphingomonas montanisoli]TZG25583.1 DUF4054 domain-containing protein [Sphingomonas montanisoli]